MQEKQIMTNTFEKIVAHVFFQMLLLASYESQN